MQMKIMSLFDIFAKNSSDKQSAIWQCDVRGNCSEPAIIVQNGALLKVLLDLIEIPFSKYKSANRSKIYIFGMSNICTSTYQK